MVRQYAHLSADHLAPYADRLCALRLVEEQNCPQGSYVLGQSGKSKGPASLQALEFVARPKRFELLTPWFVAKYSIQLSYRRIWKDANYTQF